MNFCNENTQCRRMPFVPMVAERCVNLADFRVVAVAKLCFQLKIAVVVVVTKAEQKGKTAILRVSVAGILSYQHDSKQCTHLWFHLHKQIFFPSPRSSLPT